MSKLGCFQIHSGNQSLEVGNVIRISFTRCDRKTIQVGPKVISAPGDRPKCVSSSSHTPESDFFILTVWVWGKNSVFNGEFWQFLSLQTALARPAPDSAARAPRQSPACHLCTSYCNYLLQLLSPCGDGCLEEVGLTRALCPCLPTLETPLQRLTGL